MSAETEKQAVTDQESLPSDDAVGAGSTADETAASSGAEDAQGAPPQQGKQKQKKMASRGTSSNTAKRGSSSRPSAAAQAKSNTAAILNFDAALRRCSDRESKLRAALDTVRTEMGWDYAAYWSCDEAGEGSLAADSGSLGHELTAISANYRHQSGQGGVGRVLLSGTAAVEKLSDLSPCPRAGAAGRAGQTSVVLVPVSTGTALDGVLEFYVAKGQVNADRLRCLDVVGGMLGRALAADSGSGGQSDGLQGDLVASLPLNVIYADATNTIRYLNPKSQEALRSLSGSLGISAEQFVGASLDRIHPELARLGSSVAGGAGESRDARIEIGDEKIDASVTGVRSEDGDESGCVVTWTVVTAAVAAEDEVKNLGHEAEARASELQEKVDSMLSVVQAASQGDLTRDVEVDGEDTIGRMGEGLADFLANLRGNIATIAQVGGGVADTSVELAAIGNDIGEQAASTNQQAISASTAAEQVSASVQSVATGAEEMSASISEIAKSANDAARVATEAVQMAEKTNETISKLGESSQEIGNVIKVITSIAQQTNLLALNATIEAARAGEAGKGFAVVANEVKELAKETAKATEDISKKIEAIQKDTGEAVVAIADIAKIIGTINDAQNTIATAVEEQSATTNEIGRNANQAARGSTEITENINKVATAASDTKSKVAQSLGRTQSLAELATDLESLVKNFRY